MIGNSGRNERSVEQGALLYAHTPPSGSDRFHLLSDHLNGVAENASRFAAKFGAEPIGRLLGLVHDAGKASPAFQRYLQACYKGTPATKAPHSDPSAAATDNLGPYQLELSAFQCTGIHKRLITSCLRLLDEGREWKPLIYSR